MRPYPSPFLTADEAAEIRKTLSIVLESERTISTTGKPIAVVDAEGVATVPVTPSADSQEVAA